MPVTRARKKEQVEKLSADLKNVSNAVVATYSKMTVAQDYELRKALRGAGAKYQVVKNTLAELAVKGTKIEELAEILDVEHIAEHLYTAGQPDPDLVIRTSGEQRLGGFLLWQSAHSEFYFCDAYWPAFRRVAFLRALRSYGERHRRFGA